jgi:DNA-binding MarR family transcriptional regulator
MSEISNRTYTDGQLGRSLPIRIVVLANLIARPYHERFQRKYELLLIEWRVLRAIAGAPGTTQSEIADAWGLHLANVNRVTTKLRSRGLIAAVPDPNDGRRVNFYLTEAGADVFEPAADSGAFRDEFFVSCLTEDERNTLDKLIGKMTDFVRTTPEPEF